MRRRYGRWTVAWLAVAVVSIQAASVSARSTVSAGCIRPGPTFVLSHSSITVRAGEIVWAVEAELPGGPGQIAGPGRPSTWPWLPVRSSDDHVLMPVTLCTHHRVTHGGPERVYAFRAERAGRATLSAAVVLAWRRVAGPPPLSFRAIVTVAP